MVSETRPDELYGLEVKTQDGTKIGKVDEVYLDNRTGRPEWAEVKGGLFGHRKTIVPLPPARRSEGSLELPFEADRVKNAPHVGPNAIDPAEEAQLFDYYGIPYGDATAVTAAPGRTVLPPEQAGEPPVAPPAGTPANEEAVARSEEELRVGTHPTESGRARLKKYVATEDARTTVPASHEEAGVEHEPVTDAARAGAPAEIEDEQREVVLHGEGPVLEEGAVPKERVRLPTQEVVEDAPVEAGLRKDRVDTEGVDPG